MKHLYEDMGFSLDAVDFLLRYLRRMMDLKKTIERAEKTDIIQGTPI